MKYGASRKNTGRSSNAGHNSKGIEQKPVRKIRRELVTDWSTNAAAIAELLHLLSFLGDVNSFDDPASPDSAIFIRASALSKSTKVYKT